MTKNENFPALIISYARPEGVRKIIQNCIDNNVPDIYVAVDGPKTEDVRIKHKEIIDVVESFSGSPNTNVYLLAREVNLGVGAGVISAIDWFFSEVECGHIFEDDLTVSTSYFVFGSECLRRFEFDNRVFMVSGTEISSSSNDILSARWCNYPMIWGWSTWRDSWLEMRRGLLDRKVSRIPFTLSPRKNFWTVGAKRVLDGKVDTWDTPLAAEFLSRGWLCVIPPTNLISNYGDDAGASHTGKGGFGLNLPIVEIDGDIDYYAKLTKNDINEYNKFLEKQVFKIRLRHVFSPFISSFLDRFRYPRDNLTLEAKLKLNDS